jgi:ubiquinone/menaquinone biosynthesis C-methylase UbiE
MTHNRIPETDHGIQGEVHVAEYNRMQRKLRDKGWIETDEIIKSGIIQGHALEVGHGPGYLGLEWLKKTHDTCLTGLDISPDMTALVTQNAREYGVEERTTYDTGEGDRLSYADNTFDAVFTNGSLHEWVNPQGTFEEIYRVVKPCGRFFISDMRRDMSVFIRWFLWLGCQPASVRPYLFSSIDAAYTPGELMEMIQSTSLSRATVTANAIGVIVSGQK